MINSLHIRNFKSIANAQLDFGRVNLFIGANGSGKSNLLEAVGLYAACLGRGIDRDILSSKGVRLSAARIFKSSFKKKPTPALIQLNGSIDGVEYVASLRTKANTSQLEFYSESLVEGDTRVFVRTRTASSMARSDEVQQAPLPVDANPHRGLWDTHGSLAGVSSTTKIVLNAVAQYVIYAPQTAVMRGLVPDSRPIEPLGLMGGRLPQAVREILTQSRSETKRKRDIVRILRIIWTPGWAESVRVGPPNLDVIPDALSSNKEVIYIVDKYMKRNRNTLSLYDASEGTLFLLFVAIILAHAGSPRVFALDNVDGTLNPSMVRSLVHHIVTIICDSGANGHEIGNGGRQVFLTSHNPSALDAIDLFEPEQRLFVVSRNDEGHTIFDRIRPPMGMTKEQWISAKNGKNLSQLWLDGRIRKALG